MKTSVIRVNRRRKRKPPENAFFKKEGQEPGFFADTAPETFFHPAENTIQRKPDEPEEGEKMKPETDKKKGDQKLKQLSEKKDDE